VLFNEIIVAFECVVSVFFFMAIEILSVFGFPSNKLFDDFSFIYFILERSFRIE